MSWLSRLLGFKDIVMPNIEKILEEDKRETEKIFLDKNNVRGKDISEPVLMIVQAMQNQPHRFKVKFDYKKSSMIDQSIYSVTDLKTKQKVFIGKNFFHSYEYHVPWDWLTADERKLLSDEGVAMQNIKVNKKRKLDRARMRAIYSAS